METCNQSPVPFAFGDNLVRVIEDENGNPWFVAKDVCKILEIEKYRDAVNRLDEDERGSEIVDTPGGPQTMTTLSESGLYALVFRSRKPEAKIFSKWVRSEVLPAIRRTGQYTSSSCVKHIGRLSDELPASALELKPAMRQRLWRDALDTARLDGGDAQMVLRWFDKFCRMMACDQIVPEGGSPLVKQFFRDCCVEQPGSRVSSRHLYEAMRKWCTGKNMEMPTLKVFGASMRRLARYMRSNGSYYLDITLR